MDLTKLKDMLINPVADKVAELLSPRIAEMVTDLLKKEILDAQKYRIDKEFELKILELKMQRNNFCPNCHVFTKEAINTKVIAGSIKSNPHYICKKCDTILGAY